MKQRSGQHQSGCLTELTSAKYNTVLDSVGPFTKKMPNYSGRSICKADGKPISPDSHLSWSKRSIDFPTVPDYMCMGATRAGQYRSQVLKVKSLDGRQEIPGDGMRQAPSFYTTLMWVGTYTKLIPAGAEYLSHPCLIKMLIKYPSDQVKQASSLYFFLTDIIVLIHFLFALN